MGCKIADRVTTADDPYFASQSVSSDWLGLSHGINTGKVIHELLDEARISVLGARMQVALVWPKMKLQQELAVIPARRGLTGYLLLPL